MNTSRADLEKAKSESRVKQAYRKAAEDKYRQALKGGQRVSEGLFDPEAVQTVKLQELVAKLRKQFPELSDAELMELAKMQMGIIDKDMAGRARSIPPSERGVPLRDMRKDLVAQARRQQPQASGQPVDLTNDTMPLGGKAPPMAPQGGPPQMKPAAGGSTVQRLPGGGAVAFPSYIAEEAQRKRDYDAYMKQLEMENAKFSSEQARQDAAMRRQQQEIELRRLQEEFALEQLQMEKRRKELATPQYGAVSEALLGGRQPVKTPASYLGG